jgi:hypothetical protein
MDFAQKKLIELYADRECLILVPESNKRSKRSKIMIDTTDNEQQINLIIDEILRENTILNSLQSSLVEPKTDTNSLRLKHIEDEIERIKVKINRLRTKILIYGSK